MPRIPSVTREDLSSDDQAYYDQIVEKRGRAAGPYGVMLHSPKLAGRMGATGSYLRFECEIEDTLKEVVIMTTTREARAQYAFTAHERLAREAGVSEGTIKIITEGTAPAGLSDPGPRAGGRHWCPFDHRPRRPHRGSGPVGGVGRPPHPADPTEPR